MNAQTIAGLMTLPSQMLVEGLRSLGLPTMPSKADNARALESAGWDAARVRMACSGAITDPAAKAADEKAELATNLANKTSIAVAALTGKVTALSDTIDRVATDLTTAVAAAGAVASRAEAAALAANRAPVVDHASVAAAVASAVAAAVRPINDALAGASDEVKAQVMTVVASPVARENVLDVFGVPAVDRSGALLMVDCWGHPDAPATDPHYIWTDTLVRHFVLAQRTGENVWLGGPKGTGKSEAAKQWAAGTGRSFTRINFTKHTSPEDFIGALGLVNGATEFVPGDFLMAFTTPGAVILLDEISNADPANLAVLNALLEPHSRVNIGGRVWSRAAGVMIMGADNTLGNGDDSGRYAGTRSMNSSLLDRFARVLPFKYLPEDVEVQALMRHTGCSMRLGTHVVQAINVARAKVDSGDIVDAPSLRQLVAFIRALDLLSVREAWDTTIAAKQPAESAMALEAIRVASIDESLIGGEL